MDRPRHITYVGPSMYPTLKTLDVLYYRPGDEVQKGDVIVFRHPGDNRIIIHRVIAVTSDGIRTRGDNNNLEDPYLISLAEVLGRALYARRNGRYLAVGGGTAGECRAAALKIRRRAVHALAVALRRPCDVLAGRSPVQPPFLKVVAFRRSGGTELHLLLAGRPIGRLPSGERRWRIRRPFGLVVNEKALPRHDLEGNHE